jgi:hypothetical protein
VPRAAYLGLLERALLLPEPTWQGGAP